MSNKNLIFEKFSLNPETLTAQALGKVDKVTRSLVAPIYPSTTFERDPDGGYHSGRGYSRPHNPTYDEPEELLAALEGGSDCILLASGMAAVTAVFQSLLPGDHVVVPRVQYWAIRKWLIESAMSWGLDVEFVDTRNPDQLKRAMRPGTTRLVWLETPANPTWDITDIAAAAEIAHTAGARLAIDSTVASPVITRPIELGADLVIHSATKYLNGHSDVVAGAIVCRKQDAFWQRIKAWRRDGGAVLGPFEAWLLLRGMRTLFIRVAQCSRTASRIAHYFSDHPNLRAVLYPGLPGHPGHEIACRQMHGGFGGMLSIRHRDGEAAAMETAARVKVFKRATSLGGVESLIEHRASIEGPSTPVPADLLRLSIGLEHPEDLIADLEQALDHPVKGVAICDAAGVEDSSSYSIEAVISDKVRPIIAERGGDVEIDLLDGDTIRLRSTGSPGAVLPLLNQITALLRHYVNPDISVQLAGFDTPFGHDLQLHDREPLVVKVERILQEQINPAVAAHNGKIHLARVEHGVVYVSLSGGCQGCAMADVTIRQGVEALIRQQIPQIVSVVDSTDHSKGQDPYFKTKKGT